MATDFRICRTFQIGRLCPGQILVVFQVILMVHQVVGMSAWMPQFLSGGHGRNIRHLPCVSRKTGEQGICMFAYTCMKSNGTHLGTCIDRFYFGSCCKLEGTNSDLLGDNHPTLQPINGNQVPSSNPLLQNNYNTFVPSVPTTSLPNLLTNKFTLSSDGNFININSNNNKNNSSYPSTSSLPKTEAPISSFHGGSSTASDKTEVNSAQQLATETYFLTPSTEKIYIPIQGPAKPNKTETLSSSSGLFTTHGSSSSVFSESKRPTTPGMSFFETTQSPFAATTAKTTTTTQSYLLSTFQVVHNEAGNKDTTTTTTTKVSTTTPDVTWTPVKYVTTAPTTQQVKKNGTGDAITHKPVFIITTTRKPVKPIKPATVAPATTTTTTRKPPPKKPTQKPVPKPTTASPAKPTPAKPKPGQTTFSNRVTTSKPSTPVKKPSQPTKKPIFTSPKPVTSKPSATVKPGTRPGSTRPPRPTVSPSRPTTVRTPTTEPVFTRPAPSSTTPHYGITTFRPDLTPTTKKPGTTSGGLSHLSTFNYTPEGMMTVTTFQPQMETTISNEISSSETIFEKIPEAQEENTNVISQEPGSESHPGSGTQPDLTKQNGTGVPFFPEATKPGSTKPPPPWIQIVQSTSPEPTVSTTTAPMTTTTTRTTYTVIPLLSGVNVSDYTQVCGRRLFPQSRVVGGEKSSFGKWPWQISLRQWRTSTYLHKCGAALLNENWAITAAHCVENVPPSDLLLRLGEHDLSTEDEPYGFQERRVQIVASHPQFDPRTFEYDLALLRFYEPVKFQPNIIPVCVPEDSTNFVGQTAYVTGWGRLYEDGPLPSVLQEVSVPVINNTLCENMYRSAGYIEHIPEIFICAGWKKGGFDSCEGDSGGPMVIQRPDKRWLLAGVISWGIGCAEPNQPGVYTRISEFREWINQILQF